MWTQKIRSTTKVALRSVFDEPVAATSRLCSMILISHYCRYHIAYIVYAQEDETNDIIQTYSVETAARWCVVVLWTYTWSNPAPCMHTGEAILLTVIETDRYNKNTLHFHAFQTEVPSCFPTLTFNNLVSLNKELSDWDLIHGYFTDVAYTKCENVSFKIIYVHVATLRPAAVSRACEYVGSKATSSTNVLYDVSPSSSWSIFLN